MLGNYSKLVAAIVGAAMAWLVARFALPAEWADPSGDFVMAVQALITAIAVWAFPANKA